MIAKIKEWFANIQKNREDMEELSPEEIERRRELVKARMKPVATNICMVALALIALIIMFSVLNARG